MSNLHDALARRFAAPEWASMFEASIHDRRADFIAANLWKSRGHLTVAVEIKISRGDWLRELKTPQKQETIADYVDAIYLAVPDAKIVAPGELPDGWGLLVRRGSTLVSKVAPTVRKAKDPRPFYNRLLARYAMNEQEQNEKELENRVKQRLEDEMSRLARKEKDCDEELERHYAAREELEKLVGELRGFHIGPEDWRSLMTVVQMLKTRTYHGRDILTSTERAKEQAADALARLKELADTLKNILPKIQEENTDDEQ